MKELISIGILNHNGQQYLGSLLNSLVGQNYPNLEIIFFDNNSFDNSIQIAQRYINQFKHFKIIQSNTNLGYCRAKNRVVEESKGKYILLLDEDIILPSKKFVTNLLECHLKSKAGFTSSVLVNNGEQATTYTGGFWNYRGYTFRPKTPVDIITSLSPFEVHSPEGQVLLFEKKFYQNLGGFDEHQPYYLDVGDLGVRSLLLTNMRNIIYTREPVIHTGIERKVNSDQWAWKLRYMYPGTMRILIKNFKIIHVFLYTVPITVYYLFGSIYQALKRRSLAVMSGYIWSVVFFFRSLPNTIQLRRQIQAQRIQKNDWFLKSISRPEF